MAIISIKYCFKTLGLQVNGNIIAWFNFSTNPIIVEFIIGYFLAFYYDSLILLLTRTKHIIFILLMLISFLSIIVEWRLINFTDDMHIGLMLIPALIFFIYCIKIFDIDKISVPNFISFTARISYSIYLLHMAVIFSLIELSKLTFGEQVFDSFNARFNLFFLSLLFSWCISYLFCIKVEEKISMLMKSYIFK